MQFAEARHFPLSILKDYAFLPQCVTDTEVHVVHAETLPEQALILLENFYPDLTLVLKKLDAAVFWEAFETYAQEAAHVGSVASKSTVQDAIQSLIATGLSRAASDIHLVSVETGLSLSYRCDGQLQLYKTFSLQEAGPLVNALKVMSKMDIAESRRPQTGRFRYQMADKAPLEVRVSSHPTLYGESLVLRLLTKAPYDHSLEQLGFLVDQVAVLKKAARRKSGLIIVTGPTGSGKTTTLYSMLRDMDVHEKNVMTLEQPIEYFLPHIRQTEVQEKGVVSFADGVRSILRQDPDVILIGEIRDAETAAMAVRAAMTGHLVLTTLHTQDALGVVARLKELEVLESHVSDLVTLVVAQRLIRLLCPSCKMVADVTEDQQKLFEAYGLFVSEALYVPQGCPACYGTGYKGRLAVGEFLTASFFKKGSGKDGESFRSLVHSALQAVQAGKTSLEEAVRELDIEVFSDIKAEHV